MNSPQLLGAGRIRAWHHHGSDTFTSPRAIYVLKYAKRPKNLGGSVHTTHTCVHVRFRSVTIFEFQLDIFIIDFVILLNDIVIKRVT